MRLGEKQELFARLLPGLLDEAHRLGFAIRMGDLFRSPEVFGAVGEPGPYGHPRSAHKLKLAIDLNLFYNGQFIRSTRGHIELGEWWERQHPLCRWGGRFNDGNHYSLEHNGRK